MSSFTQAIQAISDKLEVRLAQMSQDACTAACECGLDMLSRSVQRAPIESGDLRSSGFVRVNGTTIGHGTSAGSVVAVSGTTEAEEVTVQIGYHYLPYLWRQHEDLTLRHDRTDGYRRKDGTTVNMVAGGQAKFLESVAVEEIDRYRDYIQEAARRGLER